MIKSNIEGTETIIGGGTVGRRTLLLGTALGAVAALAACAGQKGNAAVAQVAQDVATIAAGLLKTLPTIGAVPGITPEQVSKASIAIADLQTVSTQLSMAATTAVAQPLVQQVQTDVNAVVAALAGLSLPAPFPAVLEAAQVLLPVIETAVGFLVPASAASGRMSPEMARATLAAVAR